MAWYHAPQEWEDRVHWLAATLHGRSRWRLPVLLLGALFASGRRVVASWIRAAGVSDDYRDFYCFLQAVGRRWQDLGLRLLVLVMQQVLQNQQRVLLAIDDSPTKRYGPHVQGAGIHHDSTPGPSGNAFCYGHVWVTLAVIVRHPWWGTIGLPICSWLYVRKQDVPKLPKRCGWTFQAKLQQAADLVIRAAKLLQHHGKAVWVVADGAYAKRPFVQPLLQQGVTCTVYGREVVKRTKTFLATHATLGGAIRVVIVQETTGPQFFFCTDVNVGVQEIIEAFADRSAVEQVFHDVKEVWGSGQQQVRNLWANIAVWHINLWLHTLTELWAWHRSGQELVRREDSPWDDSERRPSHADRRKALQAACLEQELSQPVPIEQYLEKFRSLLGRLLRIAL